ncbi:hypothetical protein JCM8547_008446 [Rhodosporidiobolus lusitaniae]
MPDDPPDDELHLPSPDAALTADLSASVSRHLASLRTTSRPPWKRSCAPRMEVLGKKKSADGRAASSSSSSSSDDGEDEVDDSWFGLHEEDEGKGRIHLVLAAKVPRKATDALRKRFMGGRHGHGKKMSVSSAVVREVEASSFTGADDRFDTEDADDEGGAPFDTRQTTRSTFSSGPLTHSPTESVDSLVTLDLPFSSTALGRSDSLSASSSRANTPYSRTSFPALSTLPTLSEIRTFSSSSSSSPTETITPNSGFNTPSRTLSIDEGSVLGGSSSLYGGHGHKRSLSRSTFKSGKYQRLHLPGRPKFLRVGEEKEREKKKHLHSAKKENSAEASAAQAFDEQVAEALRLAGMYDEEKEKVEVDVLMEHQRGLVVFGLPKFSSAALLQMDPFEWTDGSLRPSPFTPHDYPCPPYWHWRDSEFMVDMSGDKDEEGWSYAVRFRSRFWRGEAVFPYACVRRRRWVRTRVYRPTPLLPTLPGAAGSTTNPASDLADECLDEGPSASSAAGGGEGEGSGPVDLRSACRCLPLPAERRAAIFVSSAAAGSLPRPGVPCIDRKNPFLSYRRLKIEASLHNYQPVAPSDPTGSGGGGGAGEEKEKEVVWRDAVREINYRRVVGVLKVHATLDRSRLELWRFWLKGTAGGGNGGGEGKKRREGEKGKGKEKEEEARGGGGRSEEGDKEPSRPELEDVWDVVESRLPLLLSTFDYHVSRLSFLRLILTLHPVAPTRSTHRHSGYDLPSPTQLSLLSSKLRNQLEFYSGVEELVREYGCAEGMGGNEEWKGKEGKEKREESKEEESRRRKEELQNSPGRRRTLARLRIS